MLRCIEMNFIDEAINSKLTGDDFLQAMTGIYSFPEVWGELDNYPNWIKDVITIIDYDTELQMEGLDIKNYSKVIDALKRCDLCEEANLLEKINDNISDDEMTNVYNQLAANNDYDSFWDKLRYYINKNVNIQL